MTRAILAVLLTALAGPLAAQSRAAPPVRLVLHLSIDQLLPEYLQRWEPEFTGGLGLLLREGVVYFAGEQDHAITETAPGHSTMLSGRTPAHVGIIANNLGVPDPLSPLVSGTGGGASPWRVRGSMLYDWMRAADPDVQALSISRKDRGAILPIGRAKVPVFWWAKGVFTTSRWYADSLPTWLQAWNARDPIEHLRGTAWTLLRDSATYPEPDDREFEYSGNDRTFPHWIPEDWTMASGMLEYRSQMDSLTLDVAWHGVRATGLGMRGDVDLLTISLSTLDAVGHRWGPGSREVHDHMLRVDRWLGAFLDSLATQVPLDQVIIALTADHGIQEYPEAGVGGRQTMSGFARELNTSMRARWGIDVNASIESGLLLGDRAALRARGVDVDSLSDVLAAQLGALPGVARVHTPRSLAAASPDDSAAARWQRSLPDGAGWFVAAELADRWIWSGSRTSTSHNTTAEANRRVPVLFRVPGLAPARPTRVIRTVDIAPTLAALLGIAPTERVDGVPLPEVSAPRSPR